jgi:tagaturonate epimerase
VVNVAADPTAQLVSVEGRSMLAVPVNLEGFAGEPYEVDGRPVRLVEKNAASAAAVRELVPSLRPHALGTTPSFGFGDRTGLATPGHIRALRSSGSTLAPVLAQQSARELERTGRSFTDVLDAATWGVLESGWTAGYGADADHLRTTAEVEGALAAGFTMFTLDPSAHVNESARSATSADLQRAIDGLPWQVLEDDWQALRSRYAATEDDLTIARAAGVFGHALAHVVQLANVLEGASLDIEVSVDEADAPTTPFEHRFLAVELNRLGVAFTSLAPRFPGRWEKALDVGGDLESIARAIRAHADIAAEHGAYKLSIHSGSDKFSVYARIVEATGGSLHVKTSGTSYLEALRVIAGSNADLFREILTIAQERFGLDRNSYELSPSAHVPSGEGDLAPLLDDPGARQGLHVTFGAVLSHPQIGPALLEALHDAADDYARALESHLGRHLSLLQ